MHRGWHGLRRGSTWLLAGLGLLLLGAPAGAQVPQGRPGVFPGFTAPPNDEVAPRLFEGPAGRTWRLWERRGDRRAGGGAVLLAVAEREGWRTLLEVPPAEAGVNALDPALAVGPAGELALVYQWRRHDPRAKHVRLAASDDGGKSWTQPATPLDGSGQAFEPQVAWGENRTLVVAWADERRGTRLFDIYGRRSPDGGATWEPEQRLSQFPEEGPTDLHARPRLLGDGRGRFWLLWVGLRAGRSALYLSRSTDAGRTWTPPVALSGESVSVYGHTLQRAGERLLLVWQDTRTGRDRLYAVSSADGGATWTLPGRVDHLPDGSAAVAAFPSALLGPDGEALVVWQDTRNGREDIYLARSRDGGRSWGDSDQRLDADDAGTTVSRHPRLTRAPDGRVAVTWEDDRAGYERVYLRVRAADGGWGPETPVSPLTPKTAYRLPQLLWRPDGALALAWEVWDHTAGPLEVVKQLGGRTVRP